MTPSPALTAHAQGALRLDDWGVIRAHGPDAASFLNGQLTQDMLHLRPERARRAGYCSAKGRLLASFIVWRLAEDEFALACSADLLPATLKRLSMFVLRAKCRLEDASERWPLHLLAGDAALAGPQDDGACTAQGDGVWTRLPAADGVPRALLLGSPPAASLPALSPAIGRWLEVRSGVPRIVAATVDRFVPQMVNFELLDGVNFKKGCYPGQEVVARSQYRGTLKRRCYLVDSPVALAECADVIHSEDPGQPAGTVVLAASLPEGRHCALVELKIAAAESGRLHAGTPDGPLLTLAALPYTLEPLAA
ncbi:MAG: folate-binding protein YgfZ [Burkholderiales bacterium]|nr:folate-binding protein YgfZ [Burkholderiales bacterium]